ncbi:MAG: zinc ribbon domain-containing protein, partial [Chloroflexota bacterium]|nr:zinc ribbon domain-containing protein [Chloroflexota bacterium]
VWTEPEPEPVWTEPEPEPVWTEPVAAAEPEPEPEPVWTEPEPEPIAWPEAEPEPVAAAAEPEPPAPEPVRPPKARPSRPAEDIVKVPTWQVVAPDSAPAHSHPSDALSPAARTDRQIPEWPNQPAESFLAARMAARKAGDDMWAASSMEVLGPTAEAGAAPPAGVQACVSCGLSLSATARFCRRCGTRQG